MKQTDIYHAFFAGYVRAIHGLIGEVPPMTGGDPGSIACAMSYQHGHSLGRRHRDVAVGAAKSRAGVGQ